MGIALVIAVATVIILAVLLFHHSRTSSWAANEVGILVAGEKAEWLALSAIEEKRAKLRLLVNDKEQKVYELFRKTVKKGDRGDFDLTENLPTKHVDDLLTAGLLLPGATLRATEATVLEQRPIDSTIYERQGFLRFRATAAMSAGLLRNPKRTVEVVQPYKMVLTSPPRPFCSFGFFLGEMRGFTNAVAANALRDELVREHDEMWQQIEEASLAATGPLQQEYQKLISKLVPRGDGELAKRLPEEGDAALYGLSQDNLAMELSALDIEADVRRTWTQARPLEARRKQVFDILKNDFSDQSRHRQFISALEKEGKVVGKGLWNYWAFSRAFRILPWTHAAYGPMAAAYDRFEEAYWSRRAQYVVQLQGSERNINEAWARFLRLHPHPKGVIRVVNEGGPLRLTGSLQTNSIIVVGPGGVTLEDFNRSEAHEERCTVVALGGSVNLSGRVNCTLMLGRGKDLPQSFRMSPGCHLVGGLLAVAFPAQRQIQGVLYRRQKYSSGEGGAFNSDHLHVVLPPAESYRKVARR